MLKPLTGPAGPHPSGCGPPRGAGLPDGPRYPGSVVLGMPASKIEVRITNSNYQKFAQ